MEGKSLIGNVTSIRKVKDFIECAFLCLANGPFGCLSLNLRTTMDNGSLSCELSNSERYLGPHNIQDRPGYDYYGTTAKVSCQHPI